MSILEGKTQTTLLRARSTSPIVSAMLPFLVAEAVPDASEVARRVRPFGKGANEGALLAALHALADGKLATIRHMGFRCLAVSRAMLIWR